MRLRMASFIIKMIGEKAAEESIQAELRARKQKDRLETIETAKRITAAKAEEVARLNIETEAQKSPSNC